MAPDPLTGNRWVGLATGILILVSGVIAAKIAGMKCLAIAANGRGPKLKDAGADMIVDDFTKANLSELSKLFVEDFFYCFHFLSSVANRQGSHAPDHIALKPTLRLQQSLVLHYCVLRTR